MKLLTTLAFAAFISVSCSHHHGHKKCCDGKDKMSCEKKDKECCKKESKEECKDGSCKKK